MTARASHGSTTARVPATPLLCSAALGAGGGVSTRFPTLLSLSLRLRSYCKSASHLSGPRVSLCCCSSSGVGAVQEHQGWLPPLGSDRSVPMFSMQGYEIPVLIRVMPHRASALDANHRLVLKNLRYDQLEAWCDSVGEKPSRALQLWRWMYYDKFWMRHMDDAADSDHFSFGRAFREKVDASATVDGGLELLHVHTASDGTRKLVFNVLQGPAKGGNIEAVLIPIVRSTGRKERITICVSSQLGCAMNCQFCFTGRMGLGGNLQTAQIVEQLVESRRYLHSVGDATPITNVVFMGMGEPFHNLDAVMAAADIMCHPMGLHMSHNKIAVSTVGLVPEIERFCTESQVQLAVSLHATTDEVRDWIVPVNRRYPLASLMETLRRHFPVPDDGSKDRRHVLIEYIMLRDVNDTLEDARRLVSLLEGIEAKINLILFNLHDGTLFAASDAEQVAEFRSIVIQAGRVCTVRDSRGDDEMAACGQLGDPGQRKDGKPQPPILQPPPKFRKQLRSSGSS